MRTAINFNDNWTFRKQAAAICALASCAWVGRKRKGT